MSLKKIKTNFEGYKQVFPTNLDELNKIYDRVGANGASLEIMGKTIDGFLERDRPTTDDGYDWFWSLHYKTKDGKIAILFPWAQDWSKHDGVQLDRSIGAYVSVKATIQDTEGLFEKIYQKFTEAE